MPVGWGVLPAGMSGLAVVTVGDLPADATAAIEAAGVRVTEALDWDTLGDTPLGHGLIVAGVPADLGQGELELLAGLLEDGGRDALVVLEADALDAVWAVLGDTCAELLCDADAGDWTAALAMAAHRADLAPAGVREGGDAGERLRRLHEEVARIAAQLAALAPEEDAVADRRRGYGVEPGGEVAIDGAEIRRVIRARRLRTQFFDARLLEDPGWDMLLDLFAAELEGAQVSVSSLCIAAAVAPTTALRWISRMADAGLMRRVADTGDRRRAFVELSRPASDAMRAYVGAARRAGVPLA